MNTGDHIDYELFDTSALLDALEDLKDRAIENENRLLLAAMHRLEVLEDIEKRLADVPKLP